VYKTQQVGCLAALLAKRGAKVRRYFFNAIGTIKIFPKKGFLNDLLLFLRELAFSFFYRFHETRFAAGGPNGRVADSSV
jgi:hypothetical protein